MAEVPRSIMGARITTTIDLTIVLKYANFTNMNYSIKYFHPNLIAEIESWSDGILADFARKRMKEV